MCVFKFKHHKSLTATEGRLSAVGRAVRQTSGHSFSGIYLQTVLIYVKHVAQLADRPRNACASTVPFEAEF